MSRAPSQLRLDLTREPERSRRSFIVSACNADAVTLLDSPERWNGGALALVGPEGSGKSHLALDWAARNDAVVCDAANNGAAPLRLDAAHALLWDDADSAVGGEETMFHLINMAARGGALLITGRTPPRGWPVSLPDLRSRLNAMTVAELREPDDVVMAGLLDKFFRERNIRPADDVLPYLLSRIPRSGPAAYETVRRLDEAADAGRRAVTRVLASQVLEPADLFTADDD